MFAAEPLLKLDETVAQTSLLQRLEKLFTRFFQTKQPSCSLPHSNAPCPKSNNQSANISQASFVPLIPRMQIFLFEATFPCWVVDTSQCLDKKVFLLWTAVNDTVWLLRPIYSNDMNAEKLIFVRNFTFSANDMFNSNRHLKKCFNIWHQEKQNSLLGNSALKWETEQIDSGQTWQLFHVDTSAQNVYCFFSLYLLPKGTAAQLGKFLRKKTSCPTKKPWNVCSSIPLKPRRTPHFTDQSYHDLEFFFS